jgi:pimeloyl-ACP methyl ester carboxylesterase
MSPETVVLLLPGMTLNETVFPSLPCATVPFEFSNLVLGPEGSSSDLLARRMGVYVDLLDRHLDENTLWKEAKRRLVLAHSFGGMLTLAWWLAHRGRDSARVDGIVLVSTTAGPVFDVVRMRLARIGGIELRVPVAPLMALWNTSLVTRTMKLLHVAGRTSPAKVDFQKLESPNDWTVDFAGWRNTDWRAMRSYRLAMAGFDVRHRLGEIDVPVIVLHGDADTLLPLQLGRDLAGGLPRGVFRIVPGAGHILPLTHAEAVLRAVSEVAERQ